MKLRYDVFSTPFGWYAAVVSEKGLMFGSMRRSPDEAIEELSPRFNGASQDPAAVVEVREGLLAFFDGDTKALDGIALDLEGAPPFHRAAWETCRQIPLGETRSYAWLASAAGRPGAYRAAGQAMARNRVPLVVPCHRVIGSSGGLHGYGAGGLVVKERLLRAEAGMAQRDSGREA